MRAVVDGVRVSVDHGNGPWPRVRIWGLGSIDDFLFFAIDLLAGSPPLSAVC